MTVYCKDGDKFYKVTTMSSGAAMLTSVNLTDKVIRKDLIELIREEEFMKAAKQIPHYEMIVGEQG